MIGRLPARLRIDLISTEIQLKQLGDLPTHVIPPLLFLIWAARSSAYSFDY